MIMFTLKLALPDEQVAEGWEDDLHEAVVSLRARLDEFYGDDGGAYQPEIMSATAERVDDVITLLSGWLDSPQCVCGNDATDAGFGQVGEGGVFLPEGEVSEDELIGCLRCGRYASVRGITWPTRDDGPDVALPVIDRVALSLRGL